jgi:hypothetical protein
MKPDKLLMITACLTATAAMAQQTTLESFKGEYVFTQEGNVQTSQTITGLGLMTLDGAGNVFCNEAIQLPNETILTNCAGKYYVSADGSGTIEILYDASFGAEEGSSIISRAKFKFYAANQGKRLKAIRTENGILVTASFEKK